MADLVQKIISIIRIPAFSLNTERLILLILAIILLSFFINYFLSHSILGSSYRVFVAPGVILHELSHALFCLLTGAQMTKISFFDKTGGSVEHKPSKVPILGPVLISVAPFAIGAVAIFFLSRKIGLKEVDLNVFAFTRSGIQSFIVDLFRSINYHDYWNLVIVYLVATIAVTMTPSAQDLRNMFFSLLVLILAGAAILYFYGNKLPHVSFPSAEPIFLVLSTVAVILILSLILSMIIYAISKVIRPVA